MQLYFKFTSNSIQSNEEEKAMISFFICLALLIGGYFVYGKVVENTFAPDDRETPAVKINDGVDYVVMPQWKLFLVQLLNIAGLGPIFGAMQGALWGPVVFLWITFGTIFAGGVHDYFSGMLSERNNGASISETLTPNACSSNSARPVFRATVCISGIVINNSSARCPILLLSSSEIPGRELILIVNDPSLNEGRKLRPSVKNTPRATTKSPIVLPRVTRLCASTQVSAFS